MSHWPSELQLPEEQVPQEKQFDGDWPQTLPSQSFGTLGCVQIPKEQTSSVQLLPSSGQLLPLVLGMHEPFSQTSHVPQAGLHVLRIHLPKESQVFSPPQLMSQEPRQPSSTIDVRQAEQEGVQQSARQLVASSPCSHRPLPQV